VICNTQFASSCFCSHLGPAFRDGLEKKALLALALQQFEHWPHEKYRWAPKRDTTIKILKLVLLNPEHGFGKLVEGALGSSSYVRRKSTDSLTGNSREPSSPIGDFVNTPIDGEDRDAEGEDVASVSARGVTPKSDGVKSVDRSSPGEQAAGPALGLRVSPPVEIYLFD
jgi:hypothetical protein